MNQDDRISRYLSDQANTIHLAPAEAGEVVRRGRRRRTRRRSALVASVAAVAVLTASVAVRDGGDDTIDSDLAAAVVPTDMDWTVIQPRSGLGNGTSTALVDGALYSLSTAPGPDGGDSSQRTIHLYRSSDGAEWVEVAAPEGIRASSLASNGGTLYAVGTAPAGGGGQDVVVAASHDAAKSWSLVTLPPDIAELQADHPDKVVVGAPQVVTKDGTQVVVMVNVSARVDYSIADEAGGDIRWEVTDSGITTYAVGDCPNDGSGPDCEATPPTTGPDGLMADPEGIAVAIGEGRSEAATGGRGEELGRYTWEQLGVPAELQDLVGGKTLAYVSDDGQTFEQTQLPAGTAGSGPLLATADGYRVFLEQDNQDSGPNTIVLSSADGRSWSPVADLPGFAASAGLLGDRPAVALFGGASSESIYVEDQRGAWSRLDLSEALSDEGGLGQVQFGPLGLAAIVWSGEEDAEMKVLHSADGTTVSTVSLEELVPSALYQDVSLSVSADAITVRLTDPSDGDDTTVPTQKVVVGTPR